MPKRREMMKNTARRYSGVLIGIFSILVFILLRYFPGIAESLYGRGLYPIIRSIFDYSIGLLPFPVVYLFPVLLTYVILKPFFRRRGWKDHLRVYINFFGWMIALFYLLWGFNYARPDLSQRLAREPVVVTESMLLDFGESTVARLNEIRTGKPMTYSDKQEEHEIHLRQEVRKTLEHYAIHLSTRSRVRYMQPAGALRKFGISGIYFPFTGEALLEKAHPQPEKIFVTAHELAHSFGVTDEGEANLVAYIACIQSDQQEVQYAGHLAMWEYLQIVYRRKKMTEGIGLKETLSPLVKADLEILKAERRKYKEWVPELGDVVNDTYLKAQGIEAGTDAYLSLPVLYLQHVQK